MHKEYLPTTKEGHLNHMVEEMGEVLCAVGKIQRFGWNSVNPTDTSVKKETNQEWLLRELKDLEGAIKRFKKLVVNPTPTHFVHYNGSSIFVKEADFFIEQGGLKQKWGKGWKPIVAKSIEDARKQAEKLF